MVDASLRMSIVNLFRKFKEERGISVLYITHDLATAYYVSDRIAVMLRGRSSRSAAWTRCCASHFIPTPGYSGTPCRAGSARQVDGGNLVGRP